MPAYVAFLRAINLGATRKFPRAAIVAATEAAGGTDVATHINTGNVFLRSPRRSVAAVGQALERAYAADRGFEVPTVVLTPAELRAIADAAASYGHGGRHYVELLRQEPDAELVAELESDTRRGVVRVTGRAVHVLLPSDDGLGLGALFGAATARRLGVSTNRNAKVVGELAARWC